MSRQGYPKQLLALLNDHSLLQNTVLRLNGLRGLAAPILVCNEAHRYLVQSQMTEIGYPDVQVILEPVGRNTAPAISLAALAAQEVDPEAMLLVLPSDHVITKLDALHSGIRAATELATDGHLVTFGIEAAAPETGYGYIERAEAIQSGYHVARFVEKPDLEQAQKYVDSGQYYWNSGMFVFQSQQFLTVLKTHAPLIAQYTETAWQDRRVDHAFIRPNSKAFEDCPAESVDYAVMEVAKGVAVVPLSAGWSDIGSWQSLWTVSNKDSDLNVSKGDVIFENTAPSPIQGDVILIQNAVQNLLDNAIKYSPPDSQVEVQLERKGPWVILTFQDQGRGLPDSDAALLTERFVRGDNVADTVGSGLGLTIVEEVVRAHGGTLSFENNPDGVGACVSISFLLS